jgi:hypothetical protein
MQMVWYYKTGSMSSTGGGRGIGSNWRSISRRTGGGVYIRK